MVSLPTKYASIGRLNGDAVVKSQKVALQSLNKQHERLTGIKLAMRSVDAAFLVRLSMRPLTLRGAVECLEAHATARRPGLLARGSALMRHEFRAWVSQKTSDGAYLGI